MKLIKFLFFSLLIILPQTNEKLLESRKKIIKEDRGLRNWLKKLVINVPTVSFKIDIIGNITISNLTIDSILLGGLESETIYNDTEKSGVSLNISDIGFHVFGNFNIKDGLVQSDGTMEINATNVNFIFPFKLIKNDTTGLVQEVDTSGLKIIVDKDDLKININGSGAIGRIINLFQDFIKNILITYLMDYIQDSISDSIDPKFTELFGMANDLILNGAEPIPLNITIDFPIDLRKSSVIDTIRFLLDHFTGASGPLSFNHLFSIISNNTGILHLHEFYNESILFDFNISDSNNKSLGNLELGLLDLNITDLNTWGDFQALIPNDTSPVYLDSYTYLKSLGINLTFSVKVTLEKKSGVVTSDAILYEEADLVTKLVENKLWAQLQVPSIKGKAGSYSNKQCLNLDCIIDLFDSNGTGITLLSLNESFDYIRIQAGHGDLEEDVDKILDDLIALFVDSYKTKIPAFLNAIINSTLIDLANSYLNDFLYRTSCDSNLLDPDDGELNVPMTISAVSGALVLFTLIIFFPYILHSSNKKKEPLLDINPESEKNNNQNKENNENQINLNPKYICECICNNWLKEYARSDPEGASLFLNPNINKFWRISIPLLILLNISMFICSNSSTGASVYVLLTVGRKVKVPSLFDFGLINSVTDMWKAGVYPLSILIAFFSGIWPYVKLIMMLFVFVTPSSLLKKEKRESVLMFLDATGKWSILDSYVMILMLVAFQFDVKFPIIGELINKNVLIDVYVWAATGFLTLLTGTCMSLGLSHIITHLHRGLDEHPNQNKGKEAESYKSLLSFADNKLIGKGLFQFFITIILLGTLTLVILGSRLISFSFNFHGLAGYALGLLDISPHREYSVLDLGLSIPESYEFPNNFTIRFTQVIYFLTIFVLPITHLIVVIFLWSIPFSRKTQKLIYSISEILNAWSCLDVFVISIIAAVVEIGQFTQFIVGDKCDFINPFIQKYFTEILDGHNTCFEVKAYLQSGCWVLFAAAITYFIGSMIVMKVCRNALYERLPNEVKDYLNNKKGKSKDEIRISEIDNRYSSTRQTISDINGDRSTQGVNSDLL